LNLLEDVMASDLACCPSCITPCAKHPPRPNEQINNKQPSNQTSDLARNLSCPQPLMLQCSVKPLFPHFVLLNAYPNMPFATSEEMRRAMVPYAPRGTSLLTVVVVVGKLPGF